MENFLPHTKFNYKAAFGRATVDIRCPYCQVVTTCFCWSLAGSGKKCECGALHISFGTRAPIIKNKSKTK